MTPNVPTLKELRQRELQGPDAQVGNWLARRWARPLAIYGSWLVIRLGLSAHSITVAALLVSIGSAIAIGWGTPTGFLAGVLLGHFTFWLDRVDGQVARWQKTVSLSGVYLDYLMHHAAQMALGFGLGYGLAMQTGVLVWTIAGASIAAGWTFLNLHNECRYKAFFQPLKRSNGTYVINCRSGGQPNHSTTAHPRGLKRWTWVAYKSCEPHVVLLSLTVMAAFLLINDRFLNLIWIAYVALMAVMAPTLAAARITKAIRNRTLEREYHSWFQPLDKDVARKTKGSHSESPSHMLPNALVAEPSTR